jgi:hypothetical protein
VRKGCYFTAAEAQIHGRDSESIIVSENMRYRFASTSTIMRRPIGCLSSRDPGSKPEHPAGLMERHFQRPGENRMRIILALLLLGALLAGPVLAQDRTGSGSGPAPVAAKIADENLVEPSRSRMIVAKVKLRRVCPAGQTRCACADTGTSACCTENQRCVCTPVAHCR